MNDKNKLNSWILASRPKTLPAAVVPVLVGSALAVSYDKFYLPYSIVALLCALLIQIGTNFTNDLYDFLKGADSKQRKGPKRVLVSGLITVKQMKFGSVVLFGLAFLLGLYLVYSAGLVILWIGIISIFAGIIYTAGPFPLAYNGLGDLFVFVFFGIVGTMGTFYLHTQEFSILSFLVSLPVGALTTNILIVNNYRDVEEDRAAGKNTLAVYLGRNLTRLEFIIFLFLSYAVSLILFLKFDFNYWIFLPYITIPFTILLVRMLFTLNGEALNKTLELTAKFAGFYGLLFSAGLIL
ncbi:MAG: 1,4-dihydroxy-2-naphthoate polyprenyltransferase [Ignavibacteria bacterium]|nr:1,4-dihydroxy-2-naphthoate polyprenyltransferase [Ignavibacteria bacterium]MBT8383730.1 1,4-dihydroxy-2-naphthoate polyprenyltransferase [Ignavibacteria bacterium]MBT8391903.1 1,4-dihydroxy-2-naphthoate polyprenyltransferase [Ignavibacteria bacterium]NNL22249.1 1,4-dihydroxy-2-naphthoate polyprenyltransferase [Ignavibacteriaceae bacterium]